MPQTETTADESAGVRELSSAAQRREARERVWTEYKKSLTVVNLVGSFIFFTTFNYIFSAVWDYFFRNNKGGGGDGGAGAGDASG